MTDKDRADQAKDLLEQAKELLAGLDSEVDPLAVELSDDIQSVMDSIELDLHFGLEGELEPGDEDDFEDDDVRPIDDEGDPFDDDEDDEDEEEDDDDF